MSNGVDFRKMAVDLRGQLTTAKSELSALREELAQAKNDRDCERRACIDAHERLTAAEQRNAELVGLLENSESLLESLNCSGIMQFTRPDLAMSVRNYVREAQSRRLRAALKPTESGASE